jgi:hypothetical protein
LDESLEKDSGQPNYYASEIYAATENGIVQGERRFGILEASETNIFFNPERRLYRSEMTTMMLEAMRCLKNVEIDFPDQFETRRAEYKKAKENEKSLGTAAALRLTYDDVDVSRWYAPRVFEATVKGIVRGFGNALFYPDETSSQPPERGFVTYGQLCRMVLTSMKYVYDQNAHDETNLLTRSLNTFNECLEVFEPGQEDGIRFPKTFQCLKLYSKALSLKLPICQLEEEPPMISREPVELARRDFAAATAYRFKKALIQEGYGRFCADPSGKCDVN